MDIKIDNDYKNLCPKLTDEEYKFLEDGIKTHGCFDAIKTYNGFIIDGHNRYEICNNNAIDFKTEEMEFSSKEEVINWIISHQLGRRNLTPEQKQYLIGKRSMAEKKAPIRPLQGKKGDQSDPLKTVDKIARETKTSPGTVKRAEKFAKAIDNLAENTGEEFKQDILTRKQRVSGKDVIQLSKKTPEEQKKISKDLKSGKIKSVKEALNSNEAETEQTDKAPENDSDIQAQSSSIPVKEKYKCVKWETASLSKNEILAIMEIATDQNYGFIHLREKMWFSAKGKKVTIKDIFRIISEPSVENKKEVYVFNSDIKKVIGVNGEEEGYRNIPQSQSEPVSKSEDTESATTTEDSKSETSETETETEDDNTD